ncbi:hypothetical protein Tco_1162010, partial [Tanacetum coccineum]
KDEDDDDQDNDDDQGDDYERIDSDNDGDDFVHPKFSTHDEEDKEEDSFDHRVQTPSHVESIDDEDSDEEIQGVNVEGDEQDEEETNKEVEANELYRDVNVNLVGRDTEMTNDPCTIIQTTQVIEDTHVIITPINPEGQQQSSSMSSGFVSNMLNPSPDISINSIFNLNTKSTSLIDVPVTTIAEPPLLSATTLPPPSIPLITHLLRDEAQAENEDFINKLDDNIKKIIKDQVKEQVKAQVSKILLKIKKTVNEQLEAEVLTRSFNESKTSHAVAANLSELELKKILIDKMESNNSIHRSNVQKNLYKALVDTYKNEEDKDKKPSAGSNRGSKRRRAGKEPESTSAPKEKTSKTTGKSNEGSKSHHKSAGESAQAEEPMQTAKDLEEPAHQELETGVTEDQPDEETSQLPDCTLAQKEDTPGLTFELMKGSCKSLVELEYFLEEVYKATTDQLDWINPEGQQYPHDMRKQLPLIPNSRGCQVIPFDHFINNDLAYLSGGVSSRKYTTSVTKTKAADYGHIKWIEYLGRKRQQFYGFAINMESAHDVYSKRRIIVVTELQIIEWHNYKHLDWITVRKLTNLTVEERLAFNVSLRMFTRSIVIQKCVEDLQLGVESYQKKLNLTKPDTNGTLNDVRTALDDRLKGIQMQYLPQTIERECDRDKAGAMIQAIDKQLKTRRIMRSLEKFVGGRPYEGDFWLLQRTI